ncbi:bile acid:sodium symporter family protein [Methylophaga sp. OBS1]|uniref:bile acid:sodium symporter family protein n=1 Tax=Methylophaga sp. OBS1 TaxID=2991933 RepID=UPI00225BE14B|nr:bile acid:sodium symporter family protein [Methylophaga sp. OBS1]MCX4192456.1 bile acid:sodium symporter family protein [Methylophaga sp. OBS1]
MHSLTRLLPVWAILLCLLAWWQTAWFVSLKSAILPLLAVIMFAMGLTLRLSDFRRVLTMPAVILLGVSLQFVMMPLLAWLISHGMALETLLATGLILVGASPGGTASNVMTYLAGGNVALSISLTALSTLLAVVLTPWLSWFYIDADIAVPVGSMLQTILALVIAPVVGGMLLNHCLPRLVAPLQRICPLLATLAIVFIIAIVFALNRNSMAVLSFTLLAAVVIHNALGLTLGYLAGRCFGYEAAICRTLAIEVGMQNSGLAVALAMKNFASLAALPGALFSIWHNISGSLLAAFWQWRDRRQGQ